MKWILSWEHFSKSLASLGGYVAASHEVVDFIRHNSRPYFSFFQLYQLRTLQQLFKL